MPKVKTYLRSLGLDPAQAVIQRGARNYAGPNCPGVAWNCTSASMGGLVVVQVSQAGQNTFVCDPADVYTDPPNTCFIFQMNTDGNNRATCRESTDANPVALTCDVSQFNESGNNHADIDQRVSQTTGATQDAQVSAPEQQNGSGDNHANVSQTISQSTRELSLFSQSQEAEFDAFVTRTPTTAATTTCSRARRSTRSAARRARP